MKTLRTETSIIKSKSSNQVNTSQANETRKTRFLTQNSETNPHLEPRKMNIKTWSKSPKRGLLMWTRKTSPDTARNSTRKDLETIATGHAIPTRTSAPPKDSPVTTSDQRRNKTWTRSGGQRTWLSRARNINQRRIWRTLIVSWTEPSQSSSRSWKSLETLCRKKQRRKCASLWQLMFPTNTLLTRPRPTKRRRWWWMWRKTLVRFLKRMKRSPLLFKIQMWINSSLESAGNLQFPTSPNLPSPPSKRTFFQTWKSSEVRAKKALPRSPNKTTNTKTYWSKIRSTESSSLPRTSWRPKEILPKSSPKKSTQTWNSTKEALICRRISSSFWRASLFAISCWTTCWSREVLTKRECCRWPTSKTTRKTPTLLTSFKDTHRSSSSRTQRNSKSPRAITTNSCVNTWRTWRTKTWRELSRETPLKSGD